MKDMLRVTIRRVLLVCFCVALLATAFIFEPGVKATPVDLSMLAQEVKVNPEVRTVAKYMKTRNSKLPIELAEIQAQAIVDVATEEHLPVELLVGITETESIPPFNPFSESSVGAAGLMQIYQAPNVTISQERRFDIRYNLELGSTILKGKLAATKGDLTKALAMYSGNAGDYASRVYECVGRYSMYRVRTNDKTMDVAKN